MALNIATPNDTRYSDTASDFSVMWTRLRSCFHRPSPRRTSALYLERLSHLVCFLMKNSLLFELGAFMVQRHVGL